jgi:hypothetical protein
MVFPRYLGRALWFYEKCPTVFPCLQVIWQDDNRQFPWDAECDPEVIQESAAVEEDGVLRRCAADLPTSLRGAAATKQAMSQQAATWIASLRSQ